MQSSGQGEVGRLHIRSACIRTICFGRTACKSLKKEGPLRGCRPEPLTVRPTQRGAPLRTTTYAQETFGSGRLESPATVRGFFDDSARRHRTPPARAGRSRVRLRTESERRARTPATRDEIRRRVCQRHDKSTRLRLLLTVLQKPGPVRHITFDDEGR